MIKPLIVLTCGDNGGHSSGDSQAQIQVPLLLYERHRSHYEKYDPEDDLQNILKFNIAESARSIPGWCSKEITTGVTKVDVKRR